MTGIKSKIKGKTTGPAQVGRTGYGQQKASPGRTKPTGGGGKKAPSYERGGASAGGKRAANTRGKAAPVNAKKQTARSAAAYKKAATGARGRTRQALKK